MAFDGMVWEPARLRWHGLTFSLDPGDPDTTELVLWKTAALIAQYEAFWAREAGQVERIFELGLWKGGSMAFWAEVFNPARLVGVDQSRRSRPRLSTATWRSGPTGCACTGVCTKGIRSG